MDIVYVYKTKVGAPRVCEKTSHWSPAEYVLDRLGSRWSLVSWLASFQTKKYKLENAQAKKELHSEGGIGSKTKLLGYGYSNL